MDKNTRYTRKAGKGEYVSKAALGWAGYVNIQARITSKAGTKTNVSTEWGRAFETNIKRNYNYAAEAALQQCIYKHASKFGYNAEGVTYENLYKNFRIVSVYVLRVFVRYEFDDAYTIRREHTKRGDWYVTRNEQGKYVRWQKAETTKILTPEEFSYGVEERDPRELLD